MFEWMRFTFLLLIVFQSHAFAAKACSDLFIEKMSLKYTRHSHLDIYDRDPLTDSLGAFGNSYAYRLTSGGQQFILKSYKNSKFSSHVANSEHRAQQVNMMGDLVRFHFYEKLIAKYNLNFEVVERIHAHDNQLLTRFIDGMRPIDLLKNYMLEEVDAYNKLVIETVIALLTEADAQTYKIKEFHIYRENAGDPIEIPVNKNENLKSQISRMKIQNDVLRVFMIVEHKKSKITYNLGLFPFNFIYDFDLDKFVLIDPI